jgi:hypothetical protein
MSIKNRQRGKRIESSISKILKGRRIGVLGKCDVETDKYDVEVKSREKLPKWLLNMWLQTLENCKESKTPLLIIHLHRQKI